MSSKRTKQYLMLLMVIGLVSIAAGGSGTFASFTAETTNAGNYFATGTLVLNDNGGTNTCTSATNSTNPTGADSNNLNTAGTNCDMLFKVSHFSFASTTLSLPDPLDSTCGASCALTVAAITGDAIYPGDTLTVSDGTNTETVTAKSYAAVGATSVTVDASGLANSYAAATPTTITDNNDTQLGQLTLTNAGSIDAKDIMWDASNACTAAYTEPHTTLAMGTQTLGASSGTTLTIASTGTARFSAGDPLVVVQGGDANTFIVSSQTNATTVIVTAAQNWNHAYTNAAVVSGPEFNGATAHNLCSHLQFTITETTGGFNADFSTAAGCAYGGTTNPVAANACDVAGGGTLLSGLPSTLQALNINTTANSNTSGKLLAGKSRTFLLAVRYDGSSAFDNTYQNTTATSLDLKWHIDQI